MRSLATTLLVLVLGMSPEAFGYGLSPTFGTDGLVTTDVGAPSEARGIVVQPDGKIVVAGTANGQPVLVRYLANGDLDPDFGTGGIVLLAAPYFVSTWRLVRQPDGKLLITGPAGGNLFAARVNDDGSPDPSFGTDGVFAAPVSGGFAVAFGLARQTDGSVLLGGKLDAGLALRTAVFRLLGDGSIDASFGSGGVATADRDTSTEYAYDLAVLADGKILAGGDTASSNGKRAFSVLRFLADGTLDPTFGEDGGVTSRFSSDQSARAMIVQSDGKILLAGAVDNGHGSDAAVVRYLPDGALDPSFGDGGLVTLELNGRGANATGLALQFDGSIMVGGQVGDVGAEHYLGGGVARLHPDGTLDRSWGVCGTVISENSVYGIAVEPDASVMAAGYYEGDIAVARFAANTQPFCPTAPLSGCKSSVVARSGKLTIKNVGVPTKDQIVWQWRKGAATSAADLGDPLMTAEDDYTFCVYDEAAPVSQLVYGARIPAGGGCAGRECWQAATGRFKYADKSGTPCGVQGLDLRAGPDGQARFTLKAKGVHVGAPTLPLPLPLRLQLQRAGGPCWDATISAPGVHANAGASFKATAD